jgi:hypothetical protein
VLTDLLGGQVQIMLPATVSSIEYIRAGRLGRSHSPPRRDQNCCPTSRPWLSSCRAMRRVIGLASAHQTPRRLRLCRSSTIRSGLADAKIKARLAELGGDALSPAAFGRSAHRTPLGTQNLPLLRSYHNKTLSWDDHAISLLKLTHDHLDLLPHRVTAGLAHLIKNWVHFWKGVPSMLHSCGK